MNQEPSVLEQFITKLAFLSFSKVVYKDFADRLPLLGNERVLDFGCGMGTVAYYAVKRLPQGQLTCVDSSERWIRACQRTLRKNRNITIQLFDSKSFELLEGFDLIYCHFVLHELSCEELQRFIPGLSSCLKPGGKLIFREPLYAIEKIHLIKQLTLQNYLSLKNSRITDISFKGTALESIYIKL